MVLTPEQARILGSLIEKQLATPQHYPLTLNALVAACNQTTNRDPVVSYDDHAVEAALAELKDAGLVRVVYPSHGRSATRYRQVLDELRNLGTGQSALIAALLLRGPQTAADLRVRTERMWQFENVALVEAELEGLRGGAEALTRRVPRRPGHKEDRWADAVTDATATPEAPFVSSVSAPRDDGAQAATLADLAGELSVVREEVRALRDELDGLRRQLGG